MQQKGFFLPILGVIVLILVVGTGAYYFGKNSNNTTIETSESPSQSPQLFDTSQKQVAPAISPTVDETANWKTYVDKKNQFSFKYPSNGHVETEQVSVVYIATNNKPYFTFTVRTEDNPNHLTTKHVVDKMVDDLKNNKNAPWAKSQADQTLQTMKDYSNGQITGIKLQSFDEGYPGAFGEVVEATENKIYTFYIGDGSGSNVINSDEKLLDQILSTFKFL